MSPHCYSLSCGILKRKQGNVFKAPGKHNGDDADQDKTARMGRSRLRGEDGEVEDEDDSGDDLLEAIGDSYSHKG